MNELKKKIINEINLYIQNNINRHYQFLGETGVPMDKFNRKFIPALLKELASDIGKIIKGCFEDYEKGRKNKD